VRSRERQSAPWTSRGDSCASSIRCRTVTDPAGLLALPPGFRYAIVTHAGQTKLESGELTPDRHDGTAVFDLGDGNLTLIQNHEISGASALGGHKAHDGVPTKYDNLTFESPDNVAVTPWGSLILAEDGSGANHVLSTTPGGPTYAVARNMYNESEFTGPTFSPDGKVLFVNIQEPGWTFAITGPWESYLG
jgi:secreted PhoX family phosphatase